MTTKLIPPNITQGDWRFSTTPQPNGCPIIGNGRGLMIAMLAHSVNHKDQKEEALANAALLTAAKTMAEALEMCITDLENCLERIFGTKEADCAGLLSARAALLSAGYALAPVDAE